MSAIGAFGSFGSMSGYDSLYHSRNARSAGTEAVSPVSRAETVPVQPVNRVASVQRGAAQTVQEDQQESGARFPTLREGADPAEMAVRARIHYLSGELEEKENELLYWEPSQGLEKLLGRDREPDSRSIAQEQENGLPASQEEDEGPRSAQEVMEESECQTCKNRKYQDDSDDPGVSFQTATNVAPEQAAAAVRGHEQEHVVREQAKARMEDRRVVSQSVTIHTEICPECGDVYVSGGTTRTVTKAEPVQASEPDGGKKSGLETAA